MALSSLAHGRGCWARRAQCRHHVGFQNRQRTIAKDCFVTHSERRSACDAGLLYPVAGEKETQSGQLLDMKRNPRGVSPHRTPGKSRRVARQDKTRGGCCGEASCGSTVVVTGQYLGSHPFALLQMFAASSSPSSLPFSSVGFYIYIYTTFTKLLLLRSNYSSC